MMSGLRSTRSRSVSLAFPNFPKSAVHRRSQSSLLGLSTKSIRVVLFGLGGVGKTALAVRFVTNRFIGDYDPTLETIYRHTTTVDDQVVLFEIMDTAGQEGNSLKLEDKCKWGESFIFVYDVTDKYSFDELTRLKFIASLTHSRMRVNFKPCWILIGNKSDLAERDRMVSTEEGIALGRELGCHMFREISVKESMNEACEVFEDLWREFSRLSPRSPSTSQRRKFSIRIQDKISTLDSEASACASEALKTNNSSSNSSIVSSLTNVLKRQTSVPSLHISSARMSKETLFSDQNNNEERIDRIPEHQEAEESFDPPIPTPINRRKFSCRKGFESKLSSFSSLAQSESLSKAVSVDNVYTTASLSTPPVGVGTPLTPSSRSSSSSSLNSSTSPSEVGVKMKLFRRSRSRADQENSGSRNSDSPSSDDLVLLYHEHCRRNRGRRCDVSKLTQPNYSMSSLSSSSPSYQVGGY